MFHLSIWDLENCFGSKAHTPPAGPTRRRYERCIVLGPGKHKSSGKLKYEWSVFL